MQDFRNLKVWQKAHALTHAVYRGTQRFPSDEKFGLTSQLRRACASISANIAEGCARGGDIDFARFINMAAASASETDYHLLLARDLGYLKPDNWAEYAGEAQRLQRMLNSLARRLSIPTERDGPATNDQ